MSIEELASDYNVIQARIDSINSPLVTAPELLSLLKNDIGPFMGSVVREMGELDESLADLYANAEDILQPETAGVFAALILTGRELVGHLKKLADADPKSTILAKKCAAWLELATHAEETIEEITVPAADDDDEDDGDDEDEDDEDEGDETDKEDK